MAYTIGSDKGKEIAKNMTVGSTYKASDGSTWKKNSDGSVSVTHQGVTTNNAYKPSSSGSSSKNNSGGTTGRYSSTGGDIGSYGKNQMSSGANWQEVLQTYYDRQNKASTTEGLGQYANDGLQQEMWNYIVNAQNAENQQKVDDYISEWESMWTQEQPTYESKYDPALQELLNNILNRDDFSYDATKDPLYQQYSAMYQQEGDRAMRETMANAAASAGGMNSYAITAAQQANNYYNSQMANKIPELYQLAYQMYLQDKESMVEDLGILQGLDDTQYNRYRDTMADYYNDKNFAYGLYQNAVAQGNYQQEVGYNQLVNDRNFNYGITQDNQTQSNWDKTFNNNLAQQELENKWYEDEVSRSEAEKAKTEAQNQAFALLELGQMPPAALLQAAGIDEAYAAAYLKGIQAQQAKSSSGSSGGSGGGGYTGKKTGSDDDKKKEDDSGYTGTEDNAVTRFVEELKNGEKSDPVLEHPNYNDGSVAGLGAGMINNDTLETLIKIGGVVGDEDGNFYWADGWNANNYRERMSALNGIGYLFTH